MSAVGQLTRKLQHVSIALQLRGDAGTILLQTVGPPIKADLLAVAAAAFGSDLRPFKDKAVRASVGYDEIAPEGGAVWAIGFKLRPLGVWVFGQYGAGAHQIGIVGGRRLKASLSSHPVRGPIHHPGTRGRRAIDAAWKVIRQRQHELVARAADQIVTEAFDRG